MYGCIAFSNRSVKHLESYKHWNLRDGEKFMTVRTCTNTTILTSKPLNNYQLAIKLISEILNFHLCHMTFSLHLPVLVPIL